MPQRQSWVIHGYGIVCSENQSKLKSNKQKCTGRMHRKSTVNLGNVWNFRAAFLPSLQTKCGKNSALMTWRSLLHSTPWRRIEFIFCKVRQTTFVCKILQMSKMSNDTKPFPKCNVVTIVAFKFEQCFRHITYWLCLAHGSTTWKTFLLLMRLYSSFWFTWHWVSDYSSVIFNRIYSTCSFFVLMVNDFKNWNESAWQCLFHRVSSNNWICLILPIPITITKKTGKSWILAITNA